MRALVTGSSGFIGRRFVDLAPEGHEVVAVCRDADAVPEGVEAVTADLAEPEFTSALPTDVDVVVHLAQSRQDRDLPQGAGDMVAINVAAAERLLDHARRAGARFLLASTATVYAHSTEPLTEDAPLDTSSMYAATKRSAELLAGAYAEHVPVRIARIFTPYGPGQRGRLIAELVRRVREGEPVQVKGRRGLLLSPIYADDVARALHGLLDSAPEDGAELVNVAGRDSLGIGEMAAAIGEAVGRDPVIEQVEGSEPGGLVADISKLRSLLPELEPVAFSEGIQRMFSRSQVSRMRS